MTQKHCEDGVNGLGHLGHRKTAISFFHEYQIGKIAPSKKNRSDRKEALEACNPRIPPSDCLLLPKTLANGIPVVRKNESCFENYQVISNIGSGTYANVWKVQHITTGQIYAAKLLQPHKFPTETRSRVVEMFKNEIWNLATCQCPGVITVREVIYGAEGWLIIQEFANGGTVWQEQICEEKVDAFLYFIQLVQSVLYLQEKNVVHRDLKPTNILRFNSKRIVLADFGWSEAVGDGRSHPMEWPGTLEINPPEVINFTGPLTEKVDNYAVGMNLMLFVSGRFTCRPKGLSVTAAAPYVQRAVNQVRNAEPPKSFRNQLEAWEIFLGLTAPDPRNRWSLARVLSHSWVIKMLRIVGSLHPDILWHEKVRSRPEIAQYVLDSIPSSVADSYKNLKCVEGRRVGQGKHNGNQVLKKRVLKAQIVQQHPLLSLHLNNSKVGSIKRKEIQDTKLNACNNSGHNEVRGVYAYTAVPSLFNTGNQTSTALPLEKPLLGGKQKKAGTESMNPLKLHNIMGETSLNRSSPKQPRVAAEGSSKGGSDESWSHSEAGNVASQVLLRIKPAPANLTHGTISLVPSVPRSLTAGRTRYLIPDRPRIAPESIESSRYNHLFYYGIAAAKPMQEEALATADASGNSRRLTLPRSLCRRATADGFGISCYSRIAAPDATSSKRESSLGSNLEEEIEAKSHFIRCNSPGTCDSDEESLPAGRVTALLAPQLPNADEVECKRQLFPLQATVQHAPVESPATDFQKEKIKDLSKQQGVAQQVEGQTETSNQAHRKTPSSSKMKFKPLFNDLASALVHFQAQQMKKALKAPTTGAMQPSPGNAAFHRNNFPRVCSPKSESVTVQDGANAAKSIETKSMNDCSIDEASEKGAFDRVGSLTTIESGTTLSSRASTTEECPTSRVSLPLKAKRAIDRKGSVFP